MKKLKIPASALSVQVQRVVSYQPVLAHNADQPRNPASVMKLVTSQVALDILGPAYSWKTEVWLDGDLRDEILDGDLILKGHGDPFLTPERFWQLLRGLRGRGVRQITGDVIIDDSYFAAPANERGDFDGKPQRAYNAQPHALGLNFQATEITLYADQEAGQLRAFSYPPLANLQIDNAVELIGGPCRRGVRYPKMEFRRASGATTLQLRGRYAASCGEVSSSYLVMSPQDQVGGAFRAIWSELGGKLDGIVRTGVAPSGAKFLLATSSPPLADILRSMNKFSNNLMSRLIFLTLGAERYGPPGTPEKARRVVAQWAQQTGLNAQTLTVDNGSGLSREIGITAKDLVGLLRSAYFAPQMAEFISSLPIIGVDGTMRRRLLDTDLVGKGNIKTGSIDDVSAVAGYVQDDSGRRWVVASVLNHPGLTRRANRVHDAILKWVHYGAK